MPFLTRSQLNEYFERSGIYDINDEILAEGLILKRKLARKIITKFDIFLSHSSLDRKIIFSLYKYLSVAYKRKVYVDWIVDPQLDRSKVNLNTAKKIRERMQQSEILIFATSPNAILSNWTKWEVGYFDGYKEKVAILPIMEYTFDEFKGSEFLGLYPVIEEIKHELKVNDINKYYGYTSAFNLNYW